MKEAPSTILAAAGITVGLLGVALPASAANTPMVNNYHPSGSHSQFPGHTNAPGKNKKQPPSYKCPPPRFPNRPQRPATGPAEHPNTKLPVKKDGKAGSTPSWGSAKHTIKCSPPPAPKRGNGKGNGNNGNKPQPGGHTTTWSQPDHGPSPR